MIIISYSHPNPILDRAEGFLKFLLIVILIFGAIGTIWGLVLSIYNYIKAFNQNIKNNVDRYSLKNGVSDLKHIISDYWRFNVESRNKYFNKARDYHPVFIKSLKIFAQILLFVASVAVVFFGGIFFFIMVLLHIFILLFYLLITGIANLFKKA